jgi:HK97 family phage portal protein
MKFSIELSRSENRAGSIEDPRVPVSQTKEFITFFGMDSAAMLPRVTIDAALKVPAVTAAVSFLSRTLAALPLHAYRRTDSGPVRLTGKIEKVIHENPNPQMDRFKWAQYFWQQVFTGGRGLSWIERSGQNVEALWPLNPAKTAIKRRGMSLSYVYDGREYPAEDVIDIPFMLKADQTAHYGPINLASKAIQLALAMNDYASGFFAGGGVPPLALVGPLPAGPAALDRAQKDVARALDAAKKNNMPVFPIPPGYELKPVGFDPAKGQMTEARLFQIQEIARGYQLPPVFLQDLSRGTFTNVEQQDLYLVKHLIGQWAQALEGEMNLKLFGRLNNNRYVEHNLDGLMRGDLKSRMEALARGVQTALITPNEARAIENRPNHPNPAADELLVQGATVVLGEEPTEPAQEDGDQPPRKQNGDEDDAEDNDA